MADAPKIETPTTDATASASAHAAASAQAPTPTPAPAAAPAPTASSTSHPTAAPLPASLTSTSDPLTQLEQSLDLLIKIMAASLSYLTTRASHVVVLPSGVPISAKEATRVSARLVEWGGGPGSMEESIGELVGDFVRGAKEAEGIILGRNGSGSGGGPGEGEGGIPSGLVSEEEQLACLTTLDEALRAANADFRTALTDAETLQAQLGTLLRSVQEEQARTRRSLGLQAAAGGGSTSIA